MNFCAECGARVERRWVEVDRRWRTICPACEYVFYQNPRIIVFCLVTLGEQLLMCQRACEPARGQWIAPSGYLECGETLEEGAARETFEETGLVLDPASLQLYSIINLVHIEQVAIVFRARLEDMPVLRPGPECLDVRFLSEAEMRGCDVAWQNTRGDYRRLFFEQVRAGKFCIQLASIPSGPGEKLRSRLYWVNDICESAAAASAAPQAVLE